MTISDEARKVASLFSDNDFVSLSGYRLRELIATEIERVVKDAVLYQYEGDDCPVAIFENTAYQKGRKEGLLEAAEIVDHMYYDPPYEIAKVIRSKAEEKQP